MKRLLVFHPFLFAIFPVLFLFAYNIDEVLATDLLLPILAVIALTLIVFFSLRLVTKSYTKIGIITFYFLILFFAYGYVRDLLRPLCTESFFDFSRAWFLGSVWVLLFAAGAFLVIRSRSNFITFTKYLNIVAIALVAISLINIGIYEIRTINLDVREGDGTSILKKPDNPRDIYYIILDMYGREDALKEVYNYDNSEFIEYLTNKGFYVAPKSRSNYPLTPTSLASSLNMEYINYLSDIVGAESTDTTLLHEMIANNKVSQLLKSVGYRYLFIFGGWETPDISRYADVYSHICEIAYGTGGIRISSFTNHLIRSTALEPFVGPFITDTDRNAILHGFDTLADMPDIKGPKFIYAHIKCPWSDTIFKVDGSRTPFESDGTPPRAYLDRLSLVNRRVEAVVDEILSKSDVAPIIILQGDHGFGPLEMNCRLSILNAYFFPEKGNRLLYESITPVNSFRVVFNLYFDANYDLLKDESYTVGYGHFYDFIIVPPEGDAD